MKNYSRNIIGCLSRLMAIVLLSFITSTTQGADTIILENGSTYLASELLGHEVVLGASVLCGIEKNVTDAKVVEVMDAGSADEATHLSFDGAPELLSNILLSVENNVLKIDETPILSEPGSVGAEHPFFQTQHVDGIRLGNGVRIGGKISVNGYLLRENGTYFKIPSIIVKLSTQCVKTRKAEELVQQEKEAAEMLKCYRGAAKKIYDSLRAGALEGHSYAYLTDEGKDMVSNFMINWMVANMIEKHATIQKSMTLFRIADDFANDVVVIYNEQVVSEIQKQDASVSALKLNWIFKLDFRGDVRSALEECKR